MSYRRIMRLAGWALAVNAATLLTAATLDGPMHEAARRVALLCGLG